jgi:hypothetical protein
MSKTIAVEASGDLDIVCISVWTPSDV